MLDALEIGWAIKERRSELGLTQEQLAEAAGISSRSLWSIELGRNPGVQLDKLTAVLGVLGLDLSISPSHDDLPAQQTVQATAPAVKDAWTRGSAGIDALAILTGAAK